MPNLYNPQSLNRYSYVYNNPLKYTDPTGHDCATGYDDGVCYEAWAPDPVDIYEALVPADPPDSLSTKEFIKKYRDAQAQIKSACIDAGCYREDTWWMVDPFEAWDDEQLALLIDESKSAYQAAGLSFDDIVKQKLNNKLDVQSLKPSQYGDLILEFTWLKMNPVIGQFLWEMKLDTLHYMANLEPMFVMAHIMNDSDLYIWTVDACLHSEHCGQYGGPITILK